MDAPVMRRIDRRKDLADLYTAKSDPKIIDVPPLDYLMIDGAGDPNSSPEFSAAIEALYGVSYTVKFSLRDRASPVDYAVMPLEGLWWADDMAALSGVSEAHGNGR